MRHSNGRLLQWAPRVLAMALIALVSVFALDVFAEGRGALQTALALVQHLIPSAVLALGLLLAWRRAWVGTLVFGGAGVAYVLWAVARTGLPVATKLLWSATIAGPAFVVAGLFWLSWRAARRAR